MFKHKFMCVCMYIYIYTCVYAWINNCAFSEYIYINVCAYVYTWKLHWQCSFLNIDFGTHKPRTPEL